MSGAAIAAAKMREMLNLEEEELVKYNNEELNNEWEFKIVRSVMGSFKHPHVLEQVIKEESIYGWELIEKFDNARLRFKRKKNNDFGKITSTVNDQYRSYYGMSPGKFTAIVLLITFGLTGLFILIILLITFSFIK
jgi:hypothetical protein